MKRILLLAWSCVCLAQLGHAQATRAISGTILDITGSPLIGATVDLEGSDNYTITDLDGNFRLKVAAETSELRVSYTGYISQSIDISTRTEVVVVLQDDVIGLEEVVVTGYQPVLRKDLVGAVSTVRGDELNKEAGVTAQSALRRAAGVVVQQANGTPGAGFNVRVRGATSITASNEPLYVVDGVPVVSGNFAQNPVGGQGANALADINMSDVQSIEVLKDASTTAIYGSRAANGVVLITTKSGQQGDTRINVNTDYGWNTPIKKIDIVDTRSYQDYIEEQYGTRDLSLLFPTLDSTVNTNWQDVIFETAPIQNVGVTLSGGDAKTTFFSSLNYLDNQGIVKNTQFERYNARLNLNHIANDRFSADLSLAYTFSRNQRVKSDNDISGAVSAAILMPPAVPIFAADGTYASAFQLENPLASVDEYSNVLKTNRLISSGSVSYLPIESLELTARVGLDALDLFETEFEPSVLQSVPNGSISEASSRNMRLINEFLATYTGEFGTTKVVAIGGAIFQRNNLKQNYFLENDVPDNAPSGNAAASPSLVLGGLTGDVLQSYIASASLNFDSRLYISASFRADGSSRFVNNRWGYFPGLAAGYELSDLVGGFSQLKIRASYGQTGNNNIGNFVSRQLYSGSNQYLTTRGAAPLQIGNPDLRWETTATTDIGIDATLLENRVSASLGVYQKSTSDLLLNRPIPTTSGFASVFQNIGNVRNRGFEASVTLIPIEAEGIRLRHDFTAAYNENEVVTLFEDQPFDAGGFATRVAVGQPLGAFYGYVTDGLFQNEEEVEAGPRPAAAEGTRNVGPGDFRFKDLDGNGVINDADRTFIGQALPKWTGGINNVITWRSFELSAFFQFSLGNQVYNTNTSFSEGLNGVFAPTQRAYKGAWREERGAGNGDRFPRIGRGAIDINNRRTSDRFVEDGSFVRLKTLNLTYTLDSELIKARGLQSIQIYAQSTNLINWNNYSWYDPEVNFLGNNNVALGTDFLTYPQARTVQVGINLGF